MAKQMYHNACGCGHRTDDNQTWEKGPKPPAKLPKIEITPFCNHLVTQLRRTSNLDAACAWEHTGAYTRTAKRVWSGRWGAQQGSGEGGMGPCCCQGPHMASRLK